MSRRLLGGAAGYAVDGPGGQRLGKVIELVIEGEEPADSIAIRCDRIFLWKTTSREKITTVDEFAGAVVAVHV